jgi:glycosyltransferase involved in cell wall biosynthesis
MLDALRAEGVATWFDLGLLLDRLREDRDVPALIAPPCFDDFKGELHHGVGFLTFEIGIDGVSMEIAKYAEALRASVHGLSVHYIAGHFADAAEHVIDREAEWHAVPEMDAFDAWPLYRAFFQERLERGSPTYNALIGSFWDNTLRLCEALGEIIEGGDLRLLWVVNVNSNPGNVAAALAVALVSELLRIPVINNCHDFYWEGGCSEADRQSHGQGTAKVQGRSCGPRDQFFTNAHLGEVFSLVNLLYPWESRSWLHLCINSSQVDSLRSEIGCNPGGLRKVGTAIDAERFQVLDRPRIKESWKQVCEVLEAPHGRPTARAASDVLAQGRLSSERRRPLLIGEKQQRNIELESNNTVLLQPTRVLLRKRIETNFLLIQRLFNNADFARAFLGDRTRKLTLLVTGPLAAGHEATLEQIVREFDQLVGKLDPGYRDRVYLCFLFSGFDELAFRARHEHPIGMPDLYNLASLVVLPSETEGRGLPIIEAAACSAPVLTRRYEPIEVFREVVGENLAEADRLDIHVFERNSFPKLMISRLTERLLDPDLAAPSVAHNRSVVQNRFTTAVLEQDIDLALQRLHLQLIDTRSCDDRASKAFESFHARVSKQSPELDSLLRIEHREYLPGYGRMGLMLMLKSLIDPSYFRVEEQRLRGMAFDYARRLEAARESAVPVTPGKRAAFYNSVEALFLAHDGEMPLRIDHSLSYRHRNRRRYAYRELTPQELTGVITLMHRELFGSPVSSAVAQTTRYLLMSWPLMVERCCGDKPALDDRDRLLNRLSENVPFALFPGRRVELELEVVVLHAVRRRLGLSIQDELTEAKLDAGPQLAPITLIERREAAPDGFDAAALSHHLAAGPDRELRLLWKRGLCRVVESEQVSLGIDFRQLGASAVAALLEVREASGFMVALCEQAAMTTDGAAIERFHVGRADNALTANILGIAEGAGYVSWVPAGLRATLAYPTPVQTAQSLSQAFQSRRYHRACQRIGEDAVLDALSQDAYARGSRVEDVLAKLSSSGSGRARRVHYESLNGVYADGSPWSGVIAKVEKPLRYSVITSRGHNQPVPALVKRFNRTSGHQARIAWNGGYMLNAELVGKLGLPESYIGTPLGLIVSKGVLLSAPLFDKPALLVGEDKSLSIRRVNCAAGMRVRGARSTIEFAPADRNPVRPRDNACFYDLLCADDTLPGDGRILVRLVGNRIMEIIETRAGETVPSLPVGLTLSFQRGGLPRGWKDGTRLILELNDLRGVAEAVEAGPLLVADGEIAIDMEREGWTLPNSIRTQAARLDYLDMRGPKIAVGLDDKGALTVLAVNGRIRESTGATHGDMADILKARGIQTAMGFDPGGSATLVVGDDVLNISPYNLNYERNVYARPPEPRGVGNALIGY